MPIVLTISGETADDVLKQVQSFTRASSEPHSPQTWVNVRDEGNAEATNLSQLGSSTLASAPVTGSLSEVEVDDNGVPFNPETMTGSKLKNGSWRMKKDQEYPAASAAVGHAAEQSQSAETVGVEAASGAAASSEEDDEFAQFTAAAAAVDDKPVDVPARTWSDADLSKLCNQAATKLGSPVKVKEAIAEFVPDGEVPHSRNVPADKREDFAQAVEKAADIQFAG